MFTGLVEHKGRIAALERTDGGAVLRVDLSGWDHRPTPGESISVNGCCLTAVETIDDRCRFDVINQTLRLTTLGGLAIDDDVNLERSATPTTLLGGHVVQGHVDGVGRVQTVTADGREHRIRVEPPEDLVEFIVERGSITIDGVSLTIAAIDPARPPRWFEVALIPTTLERTTLSDRVAGDSVNLETDCLVRAVVHWLRLQDDSRHGSAQAT